MAINNNIDTKFTINSDILTDGSFDVLGYTNLNATGIGRKADSDDRYILCVNGSSYIQSTSDKPTLLYGKTVIGSYNGSANISEDVTAIQGSSLLIRCPTSIYMSDGNTGSNSLTVSGNTSLEGSVGIGGASPSSSGDYSLITNGTALFNNDIINKGNLSVHGDLNISGSVNSINQETLVIKDNFISINSEGTSLSTTGNVGLLTLTGNGDEAYGSPIFDTIDKSLKIGKGKVTRDSEGNIIDFDFDENQAQSIATRQDNLLTGDIVAFDANTSTLVKANINNGLGNGSLEQNDFTYTGENISINNKNDAQNPYRGTQNGDVIPGAVAYGNGAIALGGLRYEYYTSPASIEYNKTLNPDFIENFGRTPTSAEGIQSFAVGGSCHAKGNHSVVLGSDSKVVLHMGYAIGHALTVGRTLEEFTSWYGDGNNDEDGTSWEEANCYSFATGIENKVHGKGAFSAGRLNKVLGPYSAVFGEKNIVSGSHSLALGTLNTDAEYDDNDTLIKGIYTSRYNLFSGQYNTIHGLSNIITGTSNLIQTTNINDINYIASNNIVTGDGNEVYGRNSIVTGVVNRLGDKDNVTNAIHNLIVNGSNNTITGSQSLMTGESNKVVIKHGLVAGYGNKVTIDVSNGQTRGSFILGNMLECTSNGKIVLGNFNKDKGNDTILEVGVGFEQGAGKEPHRTNALEVYRSTGNVNILGKTTTKGITSTDNIDVTGNISTSGFLTAGSYVQATSQYTDSAGNYLGRLTYSGLSLKTTDKYYTTLTGNMTPKLSMNQNGLQMELSPRAFKLGIGGFGGTEIGDGSFLIRGRVDHNSSKKTGFMQSITNNTDIALYHQGYEIEIPKKSGKLALLDDIPALQTLSPCGSNILPVYVASNGTVTACAYSIGINNSSADINFITT